MDPQISSKLARYKIRTTFDIDFVEHTLHTSDLRSRQRRVEVKTKWTREKELGSGAFGVVWREIEETSRELRAVKIIPKQLLNVREVEALAEVRDHPDLFVLFSGWFEDRNFIYLAMEYIEHGDLGQYIRDNPTQAKREVQVIGSQVLEGLVVLHAREICHRDMKPQNILIASVAPMWVKISDFGVSKRAAGTALRTSCGTTCYKAPEQQGLLPKHMRTGNQYSVAVDLWALGVIIHEVLTSEIPFLDTYQASDIDLDLTLCAEDMGPQLDSQRLHSYCNGSDTFPAESLQESGVVEEGIDFVKGLMAINPADRRSAKDALKVLLSIRAFYRALEPAITDTPHPVEPPMLPAAVASSPVTVAPALTNAGASPLSANMRSLPLAPDQGTHLSMRFAQVTHPPVEVASALIHGMVIPPATNMRPLLLTPAESPYTPPIFSPQATPYSKPSAPGGPPPVEAASYTKKPVAYQPNTPRATPYHGPGYPPTSRIVVGGQSPLALVTSSDGQPVANMPYRSRATSYPQSDVTGSPPSFGPPPPLGPPPPAGSPRSFGSPPPFGPPSSFGPPPPAASPRSFGPPPPLGPPPSTGPHANSYLGSVSLSFPSLVSRPSHPPRPAQGRSGTTPTPARSFAQDIPPTSRGMYSTSIGPALLICDLLGLSIPPSQQMRDWFTAEDQAVLTDLFHSAEKEQSNVNSNTGSVETARYVQLLMKYIKPEGFGTGIRRLRIETQPGYASALQIILENSLTPGDGEMSVDNLALAFYEEKMYGEARQCYQWVLDRRSNTLGKDHPDTLVSVFGVASAYNGQRRYEDALKWYGQALAGRERVLGENHLDTLAVVGKMAAIFRIQKKPNEALESYSRVLAGNERALGEEHPSTLMTISKRAAIFRDQGQGKEALENYGRVLAVREKVLGMDHPDTLLTLTKMADVFRRQGNYSEELKCCNRVLAAREQVLGRGHPETLLTVSKIAAALKSQGKYNEALEWQRRALSGREEALGRDHPDTKSSRAAVAGLVKQIRPLEHTTSPYDPRQKAGFGARFSAKMQKILNLKD